MYKWAHQKDPSLQLFVNDYAIISNPGKQVETTLKSNILGCRATKQLSTWL